MSNKPLVSVTISAYNHENYVQDTIKSIINQTYQNIELLIMDDGSSDSTWQKICEMKEECEKRFTRVYFETKQNEGTCITGNKLLDITKGDYIYMIASDDVAKPQAIEKEVEFLEKNSEYALCVGDDEIIDSEGRVCYWDNDRELVYDIKKAKYKTFADYLQKKKKFKFTTKKFGSYETIYLANYIPNGYTIRREVFDNFRYTPQAPLEDYNLMLHISKYYKMKFLDEVLFSYRWHATNTIKNDEKITKISNKTREYEQRVLENIDLSKCLPEVKRVFKNGALYKHINVPFIFELLKYKNFSDKRLIVKLFGKVVYQKTKKIR